MYDQLYYHSPERFTNLLTTSNDQETALLEQAASLTEGATATILHQGEDADELHLAGETYAQYADAVNAWQARSSDYESDYEEGDYLQLDPEAHRTSAKRALRSGGAIVKLTVIPGDTSSFFGNLESLRALTQQP